MNKKFLSAILFGALMVTSTGTFVSCKDYDDDIDRIDKELSEVKETIASLDSAIKAGKFVQSCNEVTGGYELVFTDGSKITIKNGTNGTNGAAGTTVIPEFRVEGNYWQVSTDKGATWVDVKDTEGNKVPARGQDGEAAGSNVSWVTVDGVEYIKRVVAEPGDVVELSEEGALLVNGVKDATLTAVGKTEATSEDVIYPYTVPENSYFALGDNRENSKDSRSFGAVTADDITGRVFVYMGMTR